MLLSVAANGLGSEAVTTSETPGKSRSRRRVGVSGALMPANRHAALDGRLLIGSEAVTVDFFKVGRRGVRVNEDDGLVPVGPCREPAARDPGVCCDHRGVDPPTVADLRAKIAKEAARALLCVRVSHSAASP